MKYALFLGCAAYGAAPEVKSSLFAIAAKLKIEFAELKEAACCGGSHLQDYDDFLALTLNARTLALAESLGLDLVTVCNTCDLVLSRAALALNSDRALAAKVNAKLAEIGLNYGGKARVRHLLYVLRDDLGFENLPVEKPLNGLRAAPFYGCHNIRPAPRGDDPFRPKALDSLISALGAKAVDYDRKAMCCGFHAQIQDSKVSAKLSGLAMSGARNAGADLIVTPCPLCQMSFDIGQKSAEKEIREPLNIPVLHLTQLLGIAMGIKEKELGLDKNVISSDRLLGGEILGGGK